MWSWHIIIINATSSVVLDFNEFDVDDNEHNIVSEIMREYIVVCIIFSFFKIFCWCIWYNRTWKSRTTRCLFFIFFDRSRPEGAVKRRPVYANQNHWKACYHLLFILSFVLRVTVLICFFWMSSNIFVLFVYLDLFFFASGASASAANIIDITVGREGVEIHESWLSYFRQLSHGIWSCE